MSKKFDGDLSDLPSGLLIPKSSIGRAPVEKSESKLGLDKLAKLKREQAADHLAKQSQTEETQGAQTSLFRRRKRHRSRSPPHSSHRFKRQRRDGSRSPPPHRRQEGDYRRRYPRDAAIGRHSQIRTHSHRRRSRSRSHSRGRHKGDRYRSGHRGDDSRASRRRDGCREDGGRYDSRVHYHKDVDYDSHGRRLHGGGDFDYRRKSSSPPSGGRHVSDRRVEEDSVRFRVLPLDRRRGRGRGRVRGGFHGRRPGNRTDGRPMADGRRTHGPMRAANIGALGVSASASSSSMTEPIIKEELKEEWSEEWADGEAYVDRHWYLDEGGIAKDATASDPFGLGAAGEWLPIVSRAEKRRRELEMKQDIKRYPKLVEFRRRIEEQRRAESKTESATISSGSVSTQMQEDNDRWQEHLLLRSGVVDHKSTAFASAKPTLRGMEEDEEVDVRVNVFVKDSVPPFLDGTQLFSKTIKPVSVVKDVTSDMAVLARKGSEALLRWRETKERLKSKGKWWQVTGATRQGRLLGLKDEEAESKKKERAKRSADDDKDEAAYDYRKANQFTKKKWSGKIKSEVKNGKDVEDRSQAVSAFSRTSLKEQRESLPIFQPRASLLRLIRDNQVVILVGETGSGKTTQLTQFLYEDGMCKRGMICCTQPRRVAAMSVAKRVSQEMGVELGEEVGYTIRFEDCTSKKTVIKYCTDGVLLREALNTSALDRYAVIVMDEAHERSLNTDILFGVLRAVVAERRDLRLIVTSATLDSAKFSSFFGGAPVFNVKGRSFKVDVVYSKSTVTDYVDAAVKQVLKCHIEMPLEESESSDILVFMTGVEDINCTCALLRAKMEEIVLDEGGVDEESGCTKRSGLPPLLVLPMYSQLPADLQCLIFEAAPKGTRKCVVSTNIAETSLTVDGIRYVIDSGFCKLKVFAANMAMDALKIVPISRANAQQRSGRAGRTQAGVAFRMYTRLQFESELLENTVPEIARSNLGNVVLLLKNLGVDELLHFPFMDPPSHESLTQSMHSLWTLGALSASGQLTACGKRMVAFPLEPALSRMLVNAVQMDCAKEIVTIVSMLSVPNVFFRPEQFAAESDAAREKFYVAESDHLTLWNVYAQWAAHRYSQAWCRRHYVHSKALRKVREVRGQLLDIMRANDMHLNAEAATGDCVRKCICSAYFMNAARLKGVGEYVHLRKGIPCHLHASSALFGTGFAPDYVVYHELVYTSKEWMRNVTAVNGEWLPQLAPQFFALSALRGQRTQKDALAKDIMNEEMAIAKSRQMRAQMRLKHAEMAAQLQARDSVIVVGAKSKAAKRQRTDPFKKKKRSGFGL